jgi:hypothetical protein
MKQASLLNKKRTRPLIVSLWMLAGVVFVLLLLFPVRDTLFRLALLGSGGAFWGGALLLFWKRLWVRIPLIALALIPVLLLLLPARPHDPTILRDTYISSLRGLHNTLYVWGGETRVGIDCSGLIRGGMREAELQEGLRTLNGELLRDAAFQWWDDSSASAIGEEHRGRTHLLQTVPSLNETDYNTLLPGDLAVTGGGVHILAYIGDRTWIQADPLPMKVVYTTAPSKSGWFSQKAKILRWRVLEPKETSGAIAAMP